MTTRGQLLTDIAAWSGIGGLTNAQQDALIRMIEAEIARRVRVQDQLARVDLVLDAQTVDLPAGWQQITSLTLQGDSRVLTQVSAKQLRESCDFGASGRPKLYAIEGDKVVLAPSPSATDPITADLAYYGRFTAMAAAGDTTTLLQAHYDLYLNLGCAIAAARGQDLELVQSFRQAFELNLQSLDESEVSRHDGGGPLVSLVEDKL